MLIKIGKHLSLLLFLLTITITSFARDSIKFYNNIYVNHKGKLIAEKPYNLYLASYLFNVKNRAVIKAKLRDGYIIEYNSNKTAYYVVYNDNSKVRELGEKTGSEHDIAHVYKYNKNGYVKEISHYHVIEGRTTFKYYLLYTTKFIYDKQLIKKVDYNKSKKKIAHTIYKYDKKGKKLYTKTYSNNSLKSIIAYDYKNNKLRAINLYDPNKTLIKKVNYYYKNNSISYIKPIIYNIKYYKNPSKKDIIKLPYQKGIEVNGFRFNNNEIVSIKGTIANIQSYIVYNFKFKPVNKEWKAEIIGTFKSYNIKNNQFMNMVKVYNTQTGNEIKTEWYNHQGKELFHKIPKDIKLTNIFKIENILNTKHLIYGKIMTENKHKIKREIIIEIYNKSGDRSWCYVSHGYYFYLISYHDKKQPVNKIHILKAGYNYKIINFNLIRNKSLLALPPTFLKSVIKKN